MQSGSSADADDMKHNAVADVMMHTVAVVVAAAYMSFLFYRRPAHSSPLLSQQLILFSVLVHHSQVSLQNNNQKPTMGATKQGRNQPHSTLCSGSSRADQSAKQQPETKQECS